MRRRDEGSSATMGLSIAAAIMATGFITAQVMIHEPPGVDPRTAHYTALATTALELLIADAGSTTSGVAWSKDPDKLSRFGLALEGARNFIDYENVKALRNGSLQRDPANGAPDYPEVRSALAIQDLDLHLRTYPVLPTLEDPRWVKEPRGRLAYFAHYDGAASPVSVTLGHTKTAATLNVTVTVQNTGATNAVYTIAVSLADKDNGKRFVTEERHTRLLFPSGSQTVWVNFDQMQPWDSDIDSVRVEITDSYGNPAEDLGGNSVGDQTLVVTPPSGNANPYGLLVTAGQAYYVSGQTVTFDGDHYNAKGKRVNGATGVFVVVGPDGKEWKNISVALPNNGYSYACPNCTAVGNYTAILWDSALKRRHVDTVHVSASQMFTEKETLGALAQTEIGLLAELVENFDPTRYSLLQPEGDVFGDDTNGPSELTELLSRYTTLVIGSEVSQTALTPSQTKRGIADWVTAGGNLVVLGTVQQQSRWLEPIYQAAQTNANGGISAPDPTHPILSSPERLAYNRYLDRGRAWDIDSDQPFTHVLSRGATGNSHQDTLTVSAPGALGAGTVVLTSYMPGSLVDPHDPLESKKLLHNLLSQSYTMLFLDYGPPIPDGVPVGSAQRLVAVPHPNVPGAVVEVRLVMYVFG